MALINWGKSSEFKIGPNKMSYDPLKNEEMKIWFSKNDFKVCPFDD